MITELKKIVGDAYVLTEPMDTQPYFHEYGGRVQGTGFAVVKPANTEEVAAVVKFCAEKNISVVPQGGNTGLVGGSVPYDAQAVVISLQRMNAIRSVDPENFSMVVEAGVPLEKVQTTAKEHQRYFPLALGSQGSCTIGGNIATNAGGILTIRYGNTRDLVLGLEVVLPDGQIWHGLNALRKDNTGYNLKHLFIGSEGTLGIVTAAVLKLYPDPGQRETFFAAMNSLEDIVAMLSHLRAEFGENILAFEIISREGIHAILDFKSGTVDPFTVKTPWALLVEITGSVSETGLRERIENSVAAAFEKNLVQDAIVAQNEQQRRSFWIMRECVSDAAQARTGGSLKHDVSVAVMHIPEFVAKANAVVEQEIPGAIPVVFGHAGDGNLHYDLTKPEHMSVEEFSAKWKCVTFAVHDVVLGLNGSFAAEHGIGTFKANELMERKSPVELQLMHKVKQALDPQNIMNPGAIWPKDGAHD